jgi:hypothetical protein
MLGLSGYLRKKQQSYYREQRALHDLARWLTVYLVEHDGQMPDSWSQLDAEGHITYIRKEGRTICVFETYSCFELDPMNRFSLSWGTDIKTLHYTPEGYINREGKPVFLIEPSNDCVNSIDYYRGVSEEIVVSVSAELMADS